MKQLIKHCQAQGRGSAVLAFAVALVAALAAVSLVLRDTAQAQAGRQSQSGNKKKNPGATGDPEELRKQQEKEEEKKVDRSQGPLTVNIDTNVVNVEAVVYNKKTGGIIQGLKKEHFEVYEDGIKQEVENFSTPDAPLTLVMVVEYSKFVDLLGSPQGGYFEPGRIEVLRPAYEFVRTVVKPKDYISIVAYDIRPTPLVDFTDDQAKLMQAVGILIRNNPAFSESNLFDTLKFVLRGGKGDAVVLEDGKNPTSEYAGLYEVNARTAILLIGSGIDTFSKINYDQARKIVENSGVPIYVPRPGPRDQLQRHPVRPHDDAPGAEHAQDLRRLDGREVLPRHLPRRNPGDVADHPGDAPQPVQPRLHAHQHAQGGQAAQDSGARQPRRPD
jgi:VWFA-related protein